MGNKQAKSKAPGKSNQASKKNSLGRRGSDQDLERLAGDNNLQFDTPIPQLKGAAASKKSAALEPAESMGAADIVTLEPPSESNSESDASESSVTCLAEDATKEKSKMTPPTSPAKFATHKSLDQSPPKLKSSLELKVQESQLVLSQDSPVMKDEPASSSSGRSTETASTEPASPQFPSSFELNSPMKYPHSKSPTSLQSPASSKSPYAQEYSPPCSGSPRIYKDLGRPLFGKKGTPLGFAAIDDNKRQVQGDASPSMLRPLSPRAEAATARFEGEMSRCQKEPVKNVNNGFASPKARQRQEDEERRAEELVMAAETYSRFRPTVELKPGKKEWTFSTEVKHNDPDPMFNLGAINPALLANLRTARGLTPAAASPRHKPVKVVLGVSKVAELERAKAREEEREKREYERQEREEREEQERVERLEREEQERVERRERKELERWEREEAEEARLAEEVRVAEEAAKAAEETALKRKEEELAELKRIEEEEAALQRRETLYIKSCGLFKIKKAGMKKPSGNKV